MLKPTRWVAVLLVVAAAAKSAEAGGAISPPGSRDAQALSAADRAASSALVDGWRRIGGAWQLDVQRSTLTGGLLDARATLRQQLSVTVSGTTMTAVTVTSGIATLDTPTTTTESFALDGRPQAERWGDLIPPGTVT